METSGNTETVLIVEDDAGIADFVLLELQHEGFEVHHASDGRKALEMFESCRPDIVILDIMLPELSGLEVLRRIRRTSVVPVILVTARNETCDKVNGLDAGADDYISKPFEIEELLARMRAVMRRSAQARTDASAAQNSSIIYKALELNPGSMSVFLQGKEISLSRTEYLLLKTLLEHRNTVLSRDTIISLVWGRNHYIDENSVDVYVRYLRAKIDDAVGEPYITTVRGSGYMIKD